VEAGGKIERVVGEEEEMLLQKKHEEIRDQVRKEIAATCREAALQRGFTERNLAELAGCENIPKGVRRVHQLLEKGKTKDRDLIHNLSGILQVEEQVASLSLQLEEEERRYQGELAEEDRALVDHFPLILEKGDQIRGEEGMSNALITERAFISVAYVGLCGYLPLGLLLDYWRRGKFTDTCGECGETVLLYGAGGSPLSGSGSMWGSCGRCGKGRKVPFDGRLVLGFRAHELFEPFQERCEEGKCMRIQALVDALMKREREER
jgi:hypothetical protein